MISDAKRVMHLMFVALGQYKEQTVTINMEFMENLMKSADALEDKLLAGEEIANPWFTGERDGSVLEL